MAEKHIQITNAQGEDIQAILCVVQNELTRVLKDGFHVGSSSKERLIEMRERLIHAENVINRAFEAL